MAKEPQQTEEACSEKEPKQQKPKLAIAEQITHLKSKGVKFAICDEEEAAMLPPAPSGFRGGDPS